MKHIYIVLFNDNVSTEGYEEVEDAISFIESRNYKPSIVKNQGWIWTDKKGNEYKIKEIRLK